MNKKGYALNLKREDQDRFRARIDKACRIFTVEKMGLYHVWVDRIAKDFHVPIPIARYYAKQRLRMINHIGYSSYMEETAAERKSKFKESMKGFYAGKSNIESKLLESEPGSPQAPEGFKARRLDESF